MKKFSFVLVFALFVCIFLPACNKKSIYEDALSEVRYDILFGESDNLKCYANVGFKEFPLENDNKKATVKNCVTFRIIPKDGNMDKVYSVEFLVDKENYGDTFSEDEITHALTVTIITAVKVATPLTVTVRTTDYADDIILSSTLPQDTIDYKQALKSGATVLYDLFQENISGGVLLGEIRMRVIVDENKSYWYMGYHYGNDKTIALLLDGATGELLAQREKN